MNFSALRWSQCLVQIGLLTLLAMGLRVSFASTGIAEEKTPLGQTTSTVQANAKQSLGLQIGHATDFILHLQRHNTESKPRPLDGEQAGRSYERYLKSFEHPIPDAFQTGTGSQ